MYYFIGPIIERTKENKNKKTLAHRIWKQNSKQEVRK